MYTDQNGILIVIDNNLLAEYVTQILSIDVTESGLWFIKYFHSIEFFNSTFLFFLLFVYPIYQPLRSGRIWHKVNF